MVLLDSRCLALEHLSVPCNHVPYKLSIVCTYTYTETDRHESLHAHMEAGVVDLMGE